MFGAGRLAKNCVLERIIRCHPTGGVRARESRSKKLMPRLLLRHLVLSQRVSVEMGALLTPCLLIETFQSMSTFLLLLL